jgi:hypothetical protein
MNNFLVRAAVLFILGATIQTANAFPRFALMKGGQCIDCHVNPTGGTMRDEGGWSYGKNNLRMFQMHSSDDSFELSPKIGKNISFGFDLRTQFLVHFKDQSTRTDFHKMTGSMYLNTEISDELSFFGRYDFVQGIYEAYGLVNAFENAYIKVGAFTPNFGIRIDDHTAFTRNGDYNKMGSVYGLGFNPLVTQTGIEAGYRPVESLFITASAGGNGSPNGRIDPAYTANILFTPEISDEFHVMFGTSAGLYRNTDVATFQNLNTGLIGGYMGFSLADFTFLAEYDNAADLYQKDSTMHALMIEGAYRLTKGFDLVLRYDAFTGDDPYTNDGSKLTLSHVIIGAEWYPYSFIEIKPQFRIYTEDPSEKNNLLVVQFHFWY